MDLDDVILASAHLAAAERRRRAASRALDVAILRAVQLGASPGRVAAAAGVSRQAVLKRLDAAMDRHTAA